MLCFLSVYLTEPVLYYPETNLRNCCVLLLHGLCRWAFFILYLSMKARRSGSFGEKNIQKLKSRLHAFLIIHPCVHISVLPGRTAHLFSMSFGPRIILCSLNYTANTFLQNWVLCSALNFSINFFPACTLELHLLCPCDNHALLVLATTTTLSLFSLTFALCRVDVFSDCADARSFLQRSTCKFLNRLGKKQKNLPW